ncbi:CidA/LrgA family protein [Azorhizobium doebereinerae]|uniref:CidA/LrgA family protein n=1 Tax=Azorhizobium doebereinerae TaxID=281091 RepID=UPI00048C4EED|nr:CidA/LrgA family protein [Azorhizobium doebereinerae]
MNRPQLRHLIMLRRTRFAQVVALAGVWFVSDTATRAAGLPVPGGVIGMLALLALFGTGLLKVHSVSGGARWLLAEMLLFFVPSVLAVLDHQEFMGAVGLKIAAVIVVGTVLVMGATAMTVDLCYRWQARHA